MFTVYLVISNRSLRNQIGLRKVLSYFGCFLCDRTIEKSLEMLDWNLLCLRRIIAVNFKNFCLYRKMTSLNLASESVVCFK